MKDTLFQNPTNRPFAFDADVTYVFDDMIERSVPFYNEIQNQIQELTHRFAQPHTTIYDLGCSTGTTLAKLKQDTLTLVGIDSSESMLEKAKKKYPEATYILHDLNTPPPLPNASIIIMNLCLQFIHPENRTPLLNHIYQHLLPGGLFILIEKVTPDAPENTALFETLYHAFKKRNGYSDNEIQHKKKALKNVLIPLTPEQNKDLLKQSGFTCIDTFFQWYSFIGLLAIKEH